MSSILSHSDGARREGLALGRGQNPHQDGLRHHQLLHNGPVGDLDLSELNGCPLGTSIRVFADQSQDRKTSLKISKTTYFIKRFWTMKRS
jgi:hypothetical protein